MKHQGRVSRFKQLAPVLLKLRSGELTMDEVRPLVQEVLVGRALYFLNRWEKRQTLYSFEDLYSMGEAAVWRAVDTWDPARRAIEDYVDCEVGRAMEKPLKAAAGYPDPRRSEPAQQVYFSDVMGQRDKVCVGKYNDGEAAAVIDNLLRLQQRGHGLGDPEAYVEQRERHDYAMGVCDGLTDEFGRLVLRLVLEGYTINGAAEAMYGSRRLRTYYGLRSPEHARRAAHAAAVRVRREVSRSAA